MDFFVRKKIMSHILSPLKKTKPCEDAFGSYQQHPWCGKLRDKSRNDKSGIVPIAASWRKRCTKLHRIFWVPGSWDSWVNLRLWAKTARNHKNSPLYLYTFVPYTCMVIIMTFATTFKTSLNPVPSRFLCREHHTKVYVKLFANLDDDFKYALLNQVQIQFFKATPQKRTKIRRKANNQLEIPFGDLHEFLVVASGFCFCQFFPGEHVSNSTHIAIPKICQDLIYGGFFGEFFSSFQQKRYPPHRAFLRMVGRRKIWFAERMKSGILAPRITHTHTDDSPWNDRNELLKILKWSTQRDGWERHPKQSVTWIWRVCFFFGQDGDRFNL